MLLIIGRELILKKMTISLICTEVLTKNGENLLSASFSVTDSLKMWESVFKLGRDLIFGVALIKTKDRGIGVNFKLKKETDLIDLEALSKFGFNIGTDKYTGRIYIERGPPPSLGELVTVTISRFGFCLELDQIKEWMALFGTIETSGEFKDHESEPVKTDIVTIAMKLRKHVPSVLPAYGRKMNVHYHGQPKVCGACFETGHVRKDCKNERVEWMQYVKIINQEIAPMSMLGKWGEILRKDPAYSSDGLTTPANKKLI